MINELFQLSEAMKAAGISSEKWHKSYKPIPNVSQKAPCFRIILEQQRIKRIESLEPEQASRIRKYGSNQGTFPAMNLAPLFRITDEEIQKRISQMIRGKLDDYSVREIQEWCLYNNWGTKFKKKYLNCIEKIPSEICTLFENTGISCEGLSILLNEVEEIKRPDFFHEELKNYVFELLEKKQNVSLALQILFYLGKKEKTVEEDYGSISVVLDCNKLISELYPVASSKYTSAFNHCLLLADSVQKSKRQAVEKDAFGVNFAPVEEPMPSVKLSAGFDVTLRTMFKGQPCQSRYGRIENASYPISPELRLDLQAALIWMSGIEQKGATWINLDKDEVLFVYPNRIPQRKVCGVSMFKRNESLSYIQTSKDFLKEFNGTKSPETDSRADRIQILILRKIDKARTKVLYTYNTDSKEIELKSEEWTNGCLNIPKMTLGQPDIPFPIDTVDTLNLFLKQDGAVSTNRFKQFNYYHGMELFFGSSILIKKDLHSLMVNGINISPYIGNILAGDKQTSLGALSISIKNIIALSGLFLYKLGIRKEEYMQEFPFLFGQLLKVSDSLHEMYCRIVRNNDVPAQLAGSSLYIAGSEQPCRTLVQLAARMNPYISWAKSYRTKNITENNKESRLVGWHLSVYEDIANRLKENLDFQTRFSDEEKAQFFIGYLAALPKRDKSINEEEGEEKHE